MCANYDGVESFKKHGLTIVSHSHCMLTRPCVAENTGKKRVDLMSQKIILSLISVLREAASFELR